MKSIDINEVHAMGAHYQNFACPYERAECATFIGNETHSNIVTSQVPLPSQRIYHYETDSQYVCLIQGKWYYLSIVNQFF